MSFSASSRRPLVISLLCVGAVGIAVASWYVFRSRPEAPLDVADATTARQSTRDDVGADPGYVMVGGVRRKVTDVKPTERVGLEEDTELDQMLDPGNSPAVPADANPQTRSVAEALRTRKHPERLSPMIPPKPFDAEAFQANPQAYLDVVEPGRVFQVAQPGPGVPPLRRLSPGYQGVTQGDTVMLRVKTTPGSPVSYTAFDLGAFENRLTSISVQADEQGIAQAEFRATPGTVEDVHILAGSPGASGQVRFTVNVQLPHVVAAEGL